MMDKKLERVLGWVNRVRVTRLKLKPLKRLPKGVQEVGSLCVIARALPSVVGHRFGVFGSVHVREPQYVSNFIAAFDDNEYPKLVQQ